MLTSRTCRQTITWPRDRAASESGSLSRSAPSASSTPKTSFTLQDISLSFPQGELSLICGRLGASTSSPFPCTCLRLIFVHRFRQIAPPPCPPWRGRPPHRPARLPSHLARRHGPLRPRPDARLVDRPVRRSLRPSVGMASKCFHPREHPLWASARPAAIRSDARCMFARLGPRDLGGRR